VHGRRCWRWWHGLHAVPTSFKPGEFSPMLDQLKFYQMKEVLASSHCVACSKHSRWWYCCGLGYTPTDAVRRGCTAARVRRLACRNAQIWNAKLSRWCAWTTTDAAWTSTDTWPINRSETEASTPRGCRTSGEGTLVTEAIAGVSDVRRVLAVEAQAIPASAGVACLQPQRCGTFQRQHRGAVANKPGSKFCSYQTAVRQSD
jgi:hypothetical protein